MGKRPIALIKLFPLLVCMFATPLQAQTHYEDDLRLLTYNVYLIQSLVAQIGQETRSDLIKSASFMKGNDVVILNELFDHKAANGLLDSLKAEYPYQTPIVGDSSREWDATEGAWRPLTLGNGGVAVISRWPILEQVQFIYSQGCGPDSFSRKGFVYIKLDKNGKIYHVVGTHAQSEAPGCSDPSAIRASQFEEMEHYLSQKNIPKSEVLFIAGDLNVIKDTPDYYATLKRLKVTEPNSYAGAAYSWDPIHNSLTNNHYSSYKNGETLDYIFVSAQHAQPGYWHNQTLDTPSARWSLKDSMFQDYSDHYPVRAFAYADSSIQTASVRPSSATYHEVYIRHDGEQRYATVNGNDPSDWLTFTDTSPSPLSSFKLDNWYPSGNAFCIRSGDFIQLQSNAHPGYYWNWHQGIAGNQGYFPKQGDSSDQLRLFLAEDHGGCLKNGDKVYFKDFDTLYRKDYYLQLRTQGEWQDHLFLWSSAVGDGELFTVEIPETQTFENWLPKLNFGTAR